MFNAAIMSLYMVHMDILLRPPVEPMFKGTLPYICIYTGAVLYGILQKAWRGMVRCGMVWCGYGMV